MEHRVRAHTEGAWVREAASAYADKQRRRAEQATGSAA
jgi:ring-1,2-phenylacetyl-CoA epoxidase subunit PaaA